MHKDLYSEFLELIEKGDESAARAFLVDHFVEFPEDLRQRIAFSFFAEAVAKETDVIQATTSIKQEGADALATLLQAKKELESMAQIDKLKQSLGTQKA